MTAEQVEDASGDSSARSRVLRIVTWPFRMLWRFFQALIVALVIGFLAAMFASVVFLAFTIVIGLLDLIFRLQIRQAISDWWTAKIEEPLKPILLDLWTRVVEWAQQAGITSIAVNVSTATSNAATEILRGLILLALFLIGGFAIYHLRIVHRVRYALIELTIAVAAMWYAIDAMAGGQFYLQHSLALFSGLYVMVRGLQNFDDGINELVKRQSENNVPNGTAHALVDLWKAIFYEPYASSSLPSRGERIAAAWKLIWPAVKAWRATRFGYKQPKPAAQSEAADLPR